MKTIQLKELFDNDELEHLLLLINNNDWENTRYFLNGKRNFLLNKGLDSDYLYYYLLAKLSNRNKNNNYKGE
jgi:hypothetical protein